MVAGVSKQSAKVGRHNSVGIVRAKSQALGWYRDEREVRWTVASGATVESGCRTRVSESKWIGFICATHALDLEFYGSESLGFGREVFRANPERCMACNHWCQKGSV